MSNASHGGLRAQDFGSVTTDDDGQEVERFGVVIDDENAKPRKPLRWTPSERKRCRTGAIAGAFRRSARGKRTRNVAPCPTPALSAKTVPP